MDQRKKITIIVLIGLTLFLGAGTLLITQLVRNNQAPTDSDAGGFGEGATKVLYDDVATVFKNSSCDLYINESIIGDFTDLGITDVAAVKYGASGNNVLRCIYYFGNIKKYAILELYGYDQSSAIDYTQQDLFNRINSAELTSTLDENEVQGVNYFFGEGNGQVEDNGCRSTFFHVQNDFEYAKITYYGLGECDGLVSFNKRIADNIAKTISEAMIGVNASFVNNPVNLLGYENIKQALQSVSCTYLLTQRTDREANAPEIVYNENAYFRTRPSEGDNIKVCEYRFDSSTMYTLRIRDIQLNEDYNTIQSFRNEIEDEFSGGFSTNTVNELEYLFGASAQDSNMCKAFVFLPGNELTFIDVEYTGQNCTNREESQNVISNFTESVKFLLDNTRD